MKCIKDRCKNNAESGMLCFQHAGENARWAREREVRATEVADRDDEAQLGDHIGEDGNPWGDD